MDVNELLKLERPLTAKEAAFVEQELLKLARELNAQIDTLTKGLDPADPDVAKLKRAGPNIVRNIEKAVAVDAEIIASDDAAMARQRAEAIYSWEKLPVYEWNKRFARVVGRLLAQLPKRYHIRAHMLSAQAIVISNAICMFYRELEPGEVVSPAELQAWRVIAQGGAQHAIKQLTELSSTTALGRSDIAHGLELMHKVRQHFEYEHCAREDSSAVVH